MQGSAERQLAGIVPGIVRTLWSLIEGVHLIMYRENCYTGNIMYVSSAFASRS